MSKIFQLVDKSGKVSNVMWDCVIDEGCLQKLEAKIQSLPPQKLERLNISIPDVQNAIKVLRALPRVSTKDISDGQDWLDGLSKKEAECWNKGLYGWPNPTLFLRNAPLLALTDNPLNYERVSALWSEVSDVKKAYAELLETGEKIWGDYLYQEFGSAMHMDPDFFDWTILMLSKIKKNTVSVKEINPLNNFWQAKSYVVYMIDENLQLEGYLGARNSRVPLHAARHFDTLKEAQKSGERACQHDGVFHVFEANVNVGVRVHQSDVDDRSMLAQALVQRSAEELTGAVSERLSNTDPKKKSRRL